MTAPPRCSKCGAYGAHDDGRRCLYDVLREALVGVELTPAEDRIVHWLAGLDRPTIDPLVSIFRKLRATR